ncbi:protein ALTERED PHOSPHATE STARVATION RESPONSE 1-like [Argentina anserina]|uniref:protein ALTERED PHOSPHATE STARVATION RESPONSE 1-like n=1 Tax=Argentina anserina TaxID=57926 RepID=UPI00217667C0|nr:protein ALTERED PHOSPHATE STARVATION RESPONSE 1-like [Potentilla anserina]
MGCVVSKKNEGDDVVWLCKERKRQLKLAVERRYAFAEAQCKYNQSLYSVAAAIRLFVARHASPFSPFLITFPSVNLENAEPIVQNNPMLLQQRPSEPTTHKSIAAGSVCDESVKLQEDPDGKSESEEGEVVCEHFYDGVEEAPMGSPERGFGWDFFNPFYDGVRADVVNGFGQSFDEDLRAVREKEGIPELEEVGEGVVSEEKVRDLSNCDVDHEEESGIEAVGDVNGNLEGERSLRVIDTPKEGRELLEALRDVEDHFMKAYDSGLDVSRMLETNMVQMQSALEEIKENSTKLIRSITRSRSTASTLSWSSSGKSLLTSSSKSSSAWTQFSNDLFDDYGAMGSGNHSLTLGRLYAWEKKLFQEVKAGEETRRLYERKCSQLRNHDVGDGINSRDKVGVEVKDLYARILVAIRSAESISQRIEKLRDDELQPQLIELLKGLMRNWQMMSELHETQNKIMSEVKSLNCPTIGMFCNDSHQLATFGLEAELQNWCACFALYFCSQKAYIEALHGWLLKFVSPETEFYLKGMSPLPSCTLNGPPLLAICHNWLAFMDKLPDRAVTSAMKSFGKDIKSLLVQQGEEHQQKRKVDGLARELDKKVLAFERTERRLLGFKFSEKETELHVPNRIEYLTGMKDQLDMFKKKLDSEKAKHQTSMQETQHIAVKGFQTGFSSVFESLAEFSKTATRLYADIITFSENAKAVDEKSSKPS